MNQDNQENITMNQKNIIMNQENEKIKLYIEREELFLDLTYSDDILNIYMNIQEYIKGCNILENLSLNKLDNFIKNYSSVYDIYYESEEDNDDIIEDDYYYY